MDFHLSMDSTECTCEGLKMITYLFRYVGKIYFFRRFNSNVLLPNDVNEEKSSRIKNLGRIATVHTEQRGRHTQNLGSDLKLY